MGWYKVWSGNREQKKSVKAESIEELLQKGKNRLRKYFQVSCSVV